MKRNFAITHTPETGSVSSPQAENGSAGSPGAKTTEREFAEGRKKKQKKQEKQKTEEERRGRQKKKEEELKKFGQVSSWHTQLRAAIYSTKRRPNRSRCDAIWAIFQDSS